MVTEDVVLYRAEIRGLKPRDDTGRMIAWHDGREYTYATTNREVARAFALLAFGTPRDHERSVYRVELSAPIVWDYDFLSDENAGFVMSHWGNVLGVVDETVSMTVEEARQVMSRYAHWVLDKSRMFDDDGYVTVPPQWRTDNRFDDDEIRQALHAFGTYPDPRVVLKFLSEHFT